MYQSLYNLAKSRDLKADPRKEMKLITAHIVISEEGDFRYIIVHDKNSEETLCPSIDSLAYASGETKYACPICERVPAIIFGAVDGKGNVTGDAKKHEAWNLIMKEAADADPNLIPIRKFTEKVDADISLKQKKRRSRYQTKLILILLQNQKKK